MPDPVKATELKLKQLKQLKFCGKSHERNKEKCPAYGQVCKKCKKENNLAAKFSQWKEK